jgi:MFS family permease
LGVGDKEDGGGREEPGGGPSDLQRFVRENLRRNYTAHFLHGMLGMTGFRLINTPTFVPAYLHTLTGSDAWVGLGMALQQLGAIVSPVIGATQIEHRKRILPVSSLLGSLMRIQLLGLALTAWFLTGGVALGLALLFLFLFGLFQGPQRVAFQYLLGKVIPVEVRGRLNAWRNFAGGAIAAGMSWLAGRYLVGGEALGNGYAATFFLAFVLTTMGLVALRLIMREPDPESVRARATLRERVRDVPRLLQEDRGFAWFMVARTLAMGMRIGQPFYFLFAASILGVSPIDDPRGFGALLAALSLAYMGADTVLNLVWGYLADRGGFRSTLVISLWLGLAALVGLMLANSFVWVVIAFVGLGAAQSGYVMATINIVMEYGEARDVPMRMALSNTAEAAMGALAPVLGGVLVLLGGYQAAFIGTLVCIAAGLLVLHGKVEEPRRRR